VNQTPSSRITEIGAHTGLTAGRFAIFLGALLLATFPGVLLGDSTFVFRDFGYVTQPFAHYFRESFWRGELPLWNPYSLCGLPFLAQWNTQTLYPPALIYLLLPLPWSLNAFCLAHLFLGGLGMYFLAHRWTASRLGASVAGTAYAFSGIAVNCLTWVHASAALGWMPVVVLLTEEAAFTGGRTVIKAVLAGALQMLTGAPEIILLTWFFVASLTMGRSLAGGLAWNSKFKIQNSPPRPLARLGLMALLVAGLAAIQLLPFLDLVLHSQRGSGYGGSTWAMPWYGWANFFVPLFYNYRWEAGVFFQPGQLWISSYYLGIAVATLALLAAWQIRRRRVWLLAVVTLACLILALGENGFVYGWVKKVFPAIGFMRYPVKFALLPALIVPILAAFAIARWERLAAGERAGAQKKLVSLTGLVAIAMLLLAGLAWRFPPPYGRWQDTVQSACGRLPWLLIFVALLLVLPRAQARKISGWAGLALPLLVWGDLLTHAPTPQPTVSAGIFAPADLKVEPRPRLGEGRAMISPAANYELFRTMLTNTAADFLCHRAALYSNCNLPEAMPKVDAFYSLYPRTIYEALAPIYISTSNYPARLADFLGAGVITAPGKLFDWQPRPTALPLVTAGQKPVFAGREETLRGLLAGNFEPQRVVYLSPDAKSLVDITNQTTAKILSAHFAPHRVDIEVQAESESLVVVAQSYYHLWRARLNIEPTPLLRANHGFQAVAVPQGRHHITLTYEDWTFSLGAVISGITGLVCLGLWRRYSGGKIP